MHAADRTPIDAFLQEAQRQVDICNACRYCEGYCAVFPAMERLPLLGGGDLTYLANLCHDCRACFQACMYAPPHEFGVEIPRLLSEARERSYAEYARPRWLARVLNGGPRAIAALTGAGALLFTVLAWTAGQADRIVAPDRAPASFYDVLPYSLMLVPSLVITAAVLLAIVWGFVAFHRDSRGGSRLGARTGLVALREIATLRWMRGGGGDCYYPHADEASASRRWLHHATAYGFTAALASTILAFVFQDVLDSDPPYPLFHPVVILGLLGGVGIVVGTTGLILEKRRATPLNSARETAMNYAFLFSLEAAAATGVLLLAVRDTRAMGALLVVHLGTVVALYLTAPYGKFVHVVYRSAAILRSAAERAAEDAPEAALPPLREPRVETTSA